jgi:hypothetical protein
MKTTNNTKTLTSLALALGFACLPATGADEPAARAPAEAAGPRVQLAILLDTSSSMNGLINQAKSQLWQIVNTFIAAKQNGQTPFVEVALYEYGNSGLAASEHWIRRLQPLSRDLDKISEELFALRTGGGEEYCGAVIRRAVDDLAWDPSPEVYKAIFIAGNEPFTQGPVKAAESCRAAATKGVVVNTIHCGSEDQGVSGGWKDGAVAADGRYLVIDSNQAVVHIETPFDAEIVKLNEKLNGTYLAYGSAAPAAVANQFAQDANAMQLAPGAAVSRAATKASANYHNSSWDLVDAAKDKDFSLAKVPEADLPEAMRQLAPAERQAHLDKMSAERTALQKQILDLNVKREAMVAEKRKAAAAAGGETLEDAMVKAVRAQAAAKGMNFAD